MMKIETMNRSVRINVWALLILIMLICFFSISVVFAHVLTPIQAEPADGEILANSPESIHLTFSEEISEKGSTLQVYDESGNQISQATGGVDLNDAQHRGLVAGVNKLKDGVYLVKWQVTPLDGDVNKGQYYFGVGHVMLPTPTATQAASEPPAKSGLPAVFWIGMGAISLVVFVAAVYIMRNTRSNH